MTVSGTLCFIRKSGRVLMQLKDPGLFGGGRWNAPGGKIRPGESPEQAAVRVVFEETGLRARGLKAAGRLEFYNGKKRVPDFIVHIFSASEFSGSPRGSKEGPLEWIAERELPYDRMWEDDRHWLPLLLEGKKFEGRFWFERDFRNLVRHEVRETAKGFKI
jgi:8-oxo-dGTP diphosphatase